MNRLSIGLLLVAVWVAITASVAILNLLLGLAVAGLPLGLLRHQLAKFARPRVRPGRLAALALLFLWELSFSAIRVAAIVLKPKIAIQPGIFAFPLSITQDFQIALLANLITLTPGTLCVDVSRNRRLLFVHALDCCNAEAQKRTIAQGFEKKILEAFGP